MIELDKRYRTRDGREVRIYAVDGHGACPVHGARLVLSGWSPESWTKDGTLNREYTTDHDLIECRTAESVVLDAIKPYFTVHDDVGAEICDALRESGHLKEDE